MFLINAYCADKGWLFNDLKYQFELSGCEISNNPKKSASAWICIRSSDLPPVLDTTIS